MCVVFFACAGTQAVVHVADPEAAALVLSQASCFIMCQALYEGRETEAYSGVPTVPTFVSSSSCLPIFTGGVN